MEDQPSYLMLVSAAGLNVIRHLHENSLCELALQYLLQVSSILIYDQNFSSNLFSRESIFVILSIFFKKIKGRACYNLYSCLFSYLICTLLSGVRTKFIEN